MDESLTIMLVDDHALFRAGLVVLLQKMPEVSQILEMGDGASALACVDERDMDLVILDYTLPDMDGLRILRTIKQQAPALPVILLSARIDTDLIQRALREHASGFIPKTATPDVILSAIKLVLNGGLYIPPEAIGDASAASETMPFEPFRSSVGGHASAPAQLTQRQMDVLRQMKNGLSNKEIAKQLNMSPSTVKVHVAAILRELAAASRTQAVSLAMERRLLD